MLRVTFEEMPIMLLQCRRKLLNVRWPSIITVIHEWRVKNMASSPCPVKVDEASVRGFPHTPIPQEHACQNEHAMMTYAHTYLSTDENTSGGLDRTH